MYYHYTNIDALFNIVQKRKVWFSSLAFMNDETEGFDLHSVLTEILHLKYGSDECKGTLDLIDTLIDTNLRFQMLFSATTLKDDISQWRAYTQLGQGVCLEFENGFIPLSVAKKVKCLYSFKQKKKAILEHKRLKANDITLDKILHDPKEMEEYIALVVETLARFKNESFKPEQEVRWVMSLKGLTDPNANILYRPHRLGLTAYQEIDINLDKIKSITIGPQVPKQNLKTIEDFIIKNNCNGYVTQSKVTLR